MRKTIYLGVSLCAILAMTGCKSNESAYKKAYEKAKQQELAQQETEATVEPIVTDVPVVVRESASVTAPVVRQERVTPQDNALMKEYNVVCGSFLTKANADGLTARMKSAGFPAFQAQNPDTRMYRVIVGTFDDRMDAATARDNFKAQYPNDEGFQGSWILQRTY